MEFKIKLGRYNVTQKSHAHVADIIWKESRCSPGRPFKTVPWHPQDCIKVLEACVSSMTLTEHWPPTSPHRIYLDFSLRQRISYSHGTKTSFSFPNALTRFLILTINLSSVFLNKKLWMILLFFSASAKIRVSEKLMSSKYNPWVLQ